MAATVSQLLLDVQTMCSLLPVCASHVPENRAPPGLLCSVQALARRTARRRMGAQVQAASLLASLGSIQDRQGQGKSQEGEGAPLRGAAWRRSMACSTYGVSSQGGTSRQCTTPLPRCQLSAGAPSRCPTWKAAAPAPSPATLPRHATHALSPAAASQLAQGSTDPLMILCC